MEKLDIRFIEELFRLCLLKNSVIETIKSPLKYQHLPTPELKQIYKDIIDHWEFNKTLPTFGVLYEKNKNSDNIVRELDRIKNSDIVDVEPLYQQLEEYIKNTEFKLLWDEVYEIHKSGKQDRAIKVMSDKSTEIVNFKLRKEGGKFIRVFKDFQRMILDKVILQEDRLDLSKIPFGILPLDIVTDGGMDRKETALWIMRSGVGKSTVLKWHGMYSARLGRRVLHIQAEGSTEEVFDKYTQLWTALPYYKVKRVSYEGQEYENLIKIAQDMVSLDRDLMIVSYEQFDEISMKDIRDCVIDYIKEFGCAPDELILDSIDLCHPGDGLNYGVDTQSIKMKLQNSSRKFKNICNEFDMRGITATQTSDVPLLVWNDPNKVITRSDSMGDKNIANSYNYVFTGNQTMAEEKVGHMRIFFDKLRYYNSSSRIYPIVTAYGNGRFFDYQKTKQVFKEIYKDE